MPKTRRELTLTEKPIQNQTAFDAALTVQDENYFLVLFGENAFFDKDIAVSNVECRVAKVALDDALYQIENDTIRTIVHTGYLASKRQGQTVQVSL